MSSERVSLQKYLNDKIDTLGKNLSEDIDSVRKESSRNYELLAGSISELKKRLEPLVQSHITVEDVDKIIQPDRERMTAQSSRLTSLENRSYVLLLALIVAIAVGVVNFGAAQGWINLF